MTLTTEELVNRLRESCPVTQGMESTEICDNYTEAADALEALTARVVALEGHLSKCLDLLDMAIEDHGKGKDWGEEDAFRMGEMFGREDIAAVQAARAKLEEQ